MKSDSGPNLQKHRTLSELTLVPWPPPIRICNYNQRWGLEWTWIGLDPVYNDFCYLDCIWRIRAGFGLSQWKRTTAFLLLKSVLRKFFVLGLCMQKLWTVFGLDWFEKFRIGSWSSEGFFQIGATGGFFLNFPGGAKSGEIWFFPLRTKESTFFWKFQLPGGQAPSPFRSLALIGLGWESFPLFGGHSLSEIPM